MENEVRKIQLKCLEILDIVDKICRKHGINYSLCGGSVVGAHLYGGCLPWDDDVDLMMTRENYNKFLSIIQSELPEGFSVNNYLFSEEFTSTFTKITNDNTTIVQTDGTVSGIFLDITVYDKVPNSFLKHIDILFWKLSQIVQIGVVEPRSIKDRIRNIVLKLFFIDKRKYLLWFQKVVIFFSNSKKYHYSELFGAYCNTLPFDAQIFENYTEIEFENKKYMIVRDYIKYLQTRYNRTDFREPKEKQVAPHYTLVDFSLPYQAYLQKKEEQKNKLENKE